MRMGKKKEREREKNNEMKKKKIYAMKNEGKKKVDFLFFFQGFPMAVYALRGGLAS